MERSIAVIYGSTAGAGGLGRQAASAIAALADGFVRVHALGPGFIRDDLLTDDIIARVNWISSPLVMSAFASRYTGLRYQHGRLLFKHDSRLGRWALTQMELLRPDYCFCFTQVGLETLRWARRVG